MAESKIVEQKIKEFEIQEFVAENLKTVGLSSTKLVPTPMGEKIVINASRPGLVVGRKGQSIKKLTALLKKKFNLENPQIEINEVENINLDPQIVAERIANSLERFGTTRFKGVGHRSLEDVMSAGALGVEILITGKVPSARAKNWRFYQGYLKKCGQVAMDGVRQAYTTAHLKTGSIGIVVKIMPPDVKLPDSVDLEKESQEEPAVEELPEKGRDAETEKPEAEDKDKEPEEAQPVQADAEAKEDAEPTGAKSKQEEPGAEGAEEDKEKEEASGSEEKVPEKEKDMEKAGAVKKAAKKAAKKKKKAAKKKKTEEKDEDNRDKEDK